MKCQLMFPRSHVYDESVLFLSLIAVGPLDFGVCAQESEPVVCSVYAILTVNCIIDYFGSCLKIDS
jgi:hypothetical protein